MHKVVLSSPFARRRACELVQKAPDDFVMTLDEQKRSLAQNDKFHAMLTDVSISMPGGRRLKPKQWQALFMDALEKESNNAAYGSRWEPSLDGEGVVNLGHKSSMLKKSEMAELITFMQAWGDQNGVRWTEQEQAA